MKRPIVAGGLVFFALLLLTQFASLQHYLLFQSTQNREEINAANLAKEKLQKALANSLSATQTLSFIVKQYGINGDFDSVGKQILESNPYIDAIELLEGGTITHVYPLKGNESVIGYNILTDVKRNIEAEKAIQKRELFFAGPFTLKQGGVAIVGRLPIFIHNKFWGFSVTLVKLSTLIRAADFDTSANGGYVFQLSKVNPETHKEEFYLPALSAFNKQHAVFVEVPTGDWRIYVARRNPETLAGFLPFSFLGFVFSFIGGFFAFYMALQPLALKKQVEEQSALIIKSEENYKNTLDRVSDAFASLDTNWCFTYMNQQAGDTFKRNPAAVIGKNIWEEFGITPDRPLYLAFHKAMAEQKYICEERFIERVGLWFEISIYPSPNGISVFFRDLSARRLAEQEVIREKNLSDAIINSLPGVFYLYNKEGKFLRWNKNFETISGYSGEEISNMHPLDFFEGDDKGVIAQRIAEVFSNGMADVEADFRNKSGVMIPYYFTGCMSVFNGEECLIGMGIDVRERKKAEMEVYREKNLSDAIINSLPGIFYLFNKEGKNLRWNKNFEIVSGYSAEEVARIHPIQLFDDEEKEVAKQRIDEVFTKGWSELEAHFLTKNKEKIPYYFNGHASTFGGEECLIGVGIDITNRKKAEQAIIESEEKYRYLFNNNPALIFIWCLENMKILEVNQTAVDTYGYTREELLKMTVLDLRPAEDWPKIRQFAGEMLMGGRLQAAGIWRHLKKNGELMYMNINSHKIQYNNQSAILSLAENVTEKVLIEEQLKKSYEDIRSLNAHMQTVREEERADIAREIHDELGQQLTALKMDVSWVKKRLTQDNPETIERLAGMLTLIDQTVKVVRRIASDLRPGILDDLGLVAALEWQLGEFEKRMGIKTTFTADINHVELEKKLSIAVFRVYQEALTNIARHSGATRVDISIKQVDGKLMLGISDNGSGFDIAKAEQKNTLGLIGMTERMRMLHGELVIDSNPGKGTRIIIKVPVQVIV